MVTTRNISVPLPLPNQDSKIQESKDRSNLMQGKSLINSRLHVNVLKFKLF